MTEKSAFQVLLEPEKTALAKATAKLKGLTVGGWRHSRLQAKVDERQRRVDELGDKAQAFERTMTTLEQVDEQELANVADRTRAELKAAPYESLEYKDATALSKAAGKEQRRRAKALAPQRAQAAAEAVEEALVGFYNPTTDFPPGYDAMSKPELEQLLKETDREIAGLKGQTGQVADFVQGLEGAPAGLGAMAAMFLPNPLMRDLKKKEALAAAIRMKLAGLSKQPKQTRVQADVDDISRIIQAETELLAKGEELKKGKTQDQQKHIDRLIRKKIDALREKA